MRSSPLIGRHGRQACTARHPLGGAAHLALRSPGARNARHWSPCRVAESTVDEDYATTMIESSLEESSATPTLQALGVPAVADAASLFDTSHIEQWTPRLALYFPVGCVLASLRTILWVGGIAIDAPWFRSPGVVAAYLALLGVRVTWRGEQHLPPGRHVLVSNHVSVGDLMLLFQRPKRYAHFVTQVAWSGAGVWSFGGAVQMLVGRRQQHRWHMLQQTGANKQP